MRKRLTLGLAAAALAAAMLPTVASATPGNPAVFTFGQCKLEGGASGVAAPATFANFTHAPFNAANDRWVVLLNCS